MRLTCDTAAQCERLAATMETLVQDAILAMVLLVVATIVAWKAYRLHRARPTESEPA